MSSAVVSTSAALGRPFLFDDQAEAEVRSLPSAGKACPEPVEGDDPDPRSSTFWQRKIQSTIKNQQSTISLAPASQLEIRPAPEMASSGISALDALTGGLPRGCLTEICGPASSGRTTVLLAALAAATRRGEYCALIDASDALDPHSIAAAGVDLDRLLWVRCGESSSPKNNSPQRHRGTEKNRGPKKDGCPILAAPFAARVGTPPQAGFKFGQNKFSTEDSRSPEHRLEQVLRATDLLLESGGFGLIILDLADLPAASARRIPLTTWFRFRRAVEHKLTILLAIEQQPIAGSCSSLRLQLSSQFSVLSSQNNATRPFVDQQQKPSHAQLLTGLEISAEILRSRLSDRQFHSSLKTGRKPAGSVSIAFHSKTNWG